MISTPGWAASQSARQPGSRPPGQRDRDAPQHAVQQWRLARVARGQAVDLLGERPAPAAGSGAEEPPDLQVDLHLPPADRGVGQPALVPAVDPARLRPALRARRRGRPRPGEHEQQPGRDRDLLDDHPGQVRKQNAQVNGTRA
jgi:hypothetical protein